MASLPDLRLRSLPSGRVGPTWDDATGDATFDDSEGHAVLASLAWHRGRVAGDPAGTLGSRLHTVGMLTGATPSTVAAYVAEALAPLVAAKRIANVQTDARRLPQSTRLSIEVRYTTRAGRTETQRIAL